MLDNSRLAGTKVSWAKTNFAPKHCHLTFIAFMLNTWRLKLQPELKILLPRKM